MRTANWSQHKYLVWPTPIQFEHYAKSHISTICSVEPVQSYSTLWNYCDPRALSVKSCALFPRNQFQIYAFAAYGTGKDCRLPRVSTWLLKGVIEDVKVGSVLMFTHFYAADPSQSFKVFSVHMFLFKAEARSQGQVSEIYTSRGSSSPML